METYHDNYVADMPRGGQDLDNGYHGRPRAQYGSNMGPSGTPTPNHGTATNSAGNSSTNVNPSDSMNGPPAATTMPPGPRRMSSSSTRPEFNKDDPPIGFDEGVLRGLCDMDCALQILADRIKQSVQSCKQIAQFFKERATIEERYGRSLSEMARNSNDLYSRSDGKAGSFVTAYQASLRVQETIAQNRLRFSQRLVEMSEELNGLAREGEKQRKVHKENGSRYQTILQESESVMDKAKARFDSTAEELERILVAKEGENYRDAAIRTEAVPNNKRGLGKALNKGLFKGKNPAQMQKHEDDVRQRMGGASEAFRKAVLESQALRQEYFNFQLPKIVRLLKDCADELDMGMQYHLTRYAYMYESTIVSEGSTLCPNNSEEGPGLKVIFENIDNRNDFKSYMQNYAVARNAPKGPRREGLYDEGYVPPLPPHLQNTAMPQAGMQQQQQPQQQQPQQPPQQPPQQQQQQQQPQQPQQHQPQQQQREQPQQQQAMQPQQQQQPQQAPLPHPPPVTNGNGNLPQVPTAVDMYAQPSAGATSTGTFGVDLGEQLARDGTEVPKVVIKCAETIEAYGLDSMGIYRLSGTTSKVQALKKALDTDIEGTNVMDEQWSSDINVVSSALKQWFRELPEPLLTYGLYHGFVEAARFENDRLRHIRLHEQVNELPDPNYATLKYFMGHLDKIRRKENINQMSASNLSIVFGPTLLGAPPEEGGLNLEHMNYQCKAIETILEKYQEIFVEEDEGGDTGQASV